MSDQHPPLMTDEERFTRLHPDLLPLVDEAKGVYQAMQRFRDQYGREPWQIQMHPSLWQCGMSHYCGLALRKNPKINYYQLV